MPFHGAFRGLSGAGNLYRGSEFHFVNDWVAPNTTYQSLVPTATVGDWSSDWYGASALVPQYGTGRLGVVALTPGTGPASYCRMKTIAGGALDCATFQRIEAEAVVGVNQLSNATNEFWVEVGLVGNGWVATVDPATGYKSGFAHCFRYKRTEGGTKWSAVNREQDTETVVTLDGATHGGVPTVDAGTIAPVNFGGAAGAGSNMFRLLVKLYADASGGPGAGSRAEYWVNDVLCATVTTNMVTHSLAHSLNILTTAGTAATQALYVDYTRLSYYTLPGVVRLP